MHRLELNHLSLAFLVTSQFEMLATLQWLLFTVLAFSTFHTEHDFLGGLGLKANLENVRLAFPPTTEWCCRRAPFDPYLLSEDGFGLTSETLLFSVVTTSALGCGALLGLLVLCHFVQFVDLALLAEGLTLLWYVHL